MEVAALARDRVIQPAGYNVARIQIPGYSSDPGQHWAQNQVNGLLLVLQVMGILVIFLSGGLVVNTISAIMTPADQTDRHHARRGRGAPSTHRHVSAQRVDLERHRA